MLPCLLVEFSNLEFGVYGRLQSHLLIFFALHCVVLELGFQNLRKDMMQLSQHAKKRSQQRGLTTENIELLMFFGGKIREGRDSLSIEFTHQERKHLRKILKECIELVDKTPYVVVGNDGTVVTAAHKHN